MRCDESEVMLHALIDGELDAGHARDVEAHVAGAVKSLPRSAPCTMS
jgi:anti-sigma factor RsiW